MAHKLAQGHFRNGKRSRGQASIDNSDDDDEEDETGRRVRWKMKKEPELRGDIKSLGMCINLLIVVTTAQCPCSRTRRNSGVC